MKTCVALVLLCSVASLAAAQGVSVDFDRRVDFGRFGTYAWLEGTPAKHADMQRAIVRAVDDELSALGLDRVEEAADVQVAVHVLVDTHTLEELDDPDSWEYWTGVTSVAATDVGVGTLVLDLVEPESGQVIWRGLATGAVNAVPRKNEKKVVRAIRKLLGYLARERS